MATIFVEQEDAIINNKINSDIEKEKLSTSIPEKSTFSHLDNPVMAYLTDERNNFSDIPTDRDSNDSFYEWQKIKNTAYNYRWEITSTVTFFVFLCGIFSWWKTGKPKNVVNSIKTLKEDQHLCKHQELIMRTINLENVNNLNDLEKDLLQNNIIQIEEEEERI